MKKLILLFVFLLVVFINSKKDIQDTLNDAEYLIKNGDQNIFKDSKNEEEVQEIKTITNNLQSAFFPSIKDVNNLNTQTQFFNISTKNLIFYICVSIFLIIVLFFVVVMMCVYFSNNPDKKSSKNNATVYKKMDEEIIVQN
jgi:hypothetical protein